MLNKVNHFFRMIWGGQPVGWKTLLPGLALTAVLLVLPTGFEGARIYQGTEKVRATVLEVDDSAIVDVGLVRTGEQACLLRIEEGGFGLVTVAPFTAVAGGLLLTRQNPKDQNSLRR